MCSSLRLAHGLSFSCYLGLSYRLGLLCGENLLHGPLCGLVFGLVLHCNLGGSLRRPFCLTVFLFKAAGVCSMGNFDCALGLGLLLQARLFFFNGLLHALAGIFACLRPSF